MTPRPAGVPAALAVREAELNGEYFAVFEQPVPEHEGSSDDVASSPNEYNPELETSNADAFVDSWPRPRATGASFTRSPLLVDELDRELAHGGKRTTLPPPQGFWRRGSPARPRPASIAESVAEEEEEEEPEPRRGRGGRDLPLILLRRVQVGPIVDDEHLSPRPTLAGRLGSWPVDRQFTESPFVRSEHPNTPTLVLHPAEESFDGGEFVEFDFDEDAKLLRVGSWHEEDGTAL
ncbi:hypothetical protein BJ170DRAFT_351371 [Xylariales sp. AK1849]|nr:hypothetical protein BJ170DRAFT_351371 [Xylariales sp. AK1849]